MTAGVACAAALTIGTPVALLVAVAGLSTVSATATCPTPAAQTPAQVGPVGQINTPTDFAAALLTALNDPVSDANVSSIVDWVNREGGNWHNGATFNPLNTTKTEPGSGVTGTQGNIGVYLSWDQGIQATVDTLLNGLYFDVVAALRAGFGLGQGSYAGLLKWSGGGYDHLADGPPGTVLVAAAASCVNPAALLPASGNLSALWTFLAAQLGKPYLWGGTGPDAFDCSGLTQQGFGAAGINLPRTAAEQYDATSSTAVPYPQAVAGMLLFWSFDGKGADSHHVAVYLGDGMMVDAPQTGSVVRIEPVWLTSDFLGIATVA